MAINNPMHEKETVIIIKGTIKTGSIEGEENLLILADWCKVFHQSTENFIIGRFIELTIIKIAVIFSPTSMFEKDLLKKIIIKYIINKIATDVNLASQTHQVPHIGFPQRDPVNKQIKVNVAPIGATAELTIKPKGILNARATIL